jgi:aspartyl/asparaginyl-tRNA synthetase
MSVGFRLTKLGPRVQTTCRSYSTSTISSLLSPERESKNQTKSVKGFVRSIRKQKNVAFAVVGDGTSLDALQVVLSPDQAQEYV